MVEREDDSLVVTGTFRTPMRVILMPLLIKAVRRLAWWLVLPPVGFLVAGLLLHDVRWMLVALIVSFLVLPMVMTFVYFNYTLSPKVAKGVLPRHFIIRKGHFVTVVYDEWPEKEGYNPPADEIIAWNRITELRREGDYWILSYD